MLTELLKSERELDTERIVILYANLSGRESANRAEFRNEVRAILEQRDSRILSVIEEWAKARRDLTGEYTPDAVLSYVDDLLTFIRNK